LNSNDASEKKVENNTLSRHTIKDNGNPSRVASFQASNHKTSQEIENNSVQANGQIN